MTFYVGQKVVCVDAKPRRYKPDLVEGNIYTIVGFAKNKYSHGAILLLETTATFQHKGYGFYPDRFRPVVEKKTDISIFEAMLNVQPSKLDEQV